MDKYNKTKEDHKNIFKLKGKQLLSHIEEIDPHGFFVIKDSKPIIEISFEKEPQILFTQIGETWFMQDLDGIDSFQRFHTHIELIIDVVNCYSPYKSVFTKRLKHKQIKHKRITRKCKKILKFLQLNKCDKEKRLYEALENSNEKFKWIDVYGRSGRFWKDFNILSFWFSESLITKDIIDELIDINSIDSKDLIITFYDEISTESTVKMYEDLDDNKDYPKIIPKTLGSLHTIVAKKKAIQGFGSMNNKHDEITSTQYWQTIQTSD